MQEVWKPVPGYEGLYEVSDAGRVRSLGRFVRCDRGKRWIKGVILIPVRVNGGYLIVNLCKDGTMKACKIHRLVAHVFLSNPDNLPEVNHKDEVKTNNCVDNLEWCDSKYNNNYGTRNNRLAEIFSKKVYQYTIDGELVKVWPSTAECKRNGFNQGTISRCCLGKLKTHKGFLWSYNPPA